MEEWDQWVADNCSLETMRQITLDAMSSGEDNDVAFYDYAEGHDLTVNEVAYYLNACEYGGEAGLEAIRRAITSRVSKTPSPLRGPQRLWADRSHLTPQVHRRYEQLGGCHIQVEYGARERADETGRGFLARRGENEAPASSIGHVRFRFHRYLLQLSAPASVDYGEEVAQVNYYWLKPTACPSTQARLASLLALCRQRWRP